MAIANASGMKGSLFQVEISFSLLVQRAVEKLRAPCQDIVDDVLGELLAMLHSIKLPALQRFVALHAAILSTAKGVFLEANEATLFLSHDTTTQTTR